MHFNGSDLNKGIYIPDLILFRWILKPMEALLYCRCLRWFLNCEEKNEVFYLDHVEAAQFFQVSRRSIITYTQALVDAGLFIETGITARKQKIYIVKDWRCMLEDVLASDEAYTEQKERYQAERERNRAQYDARLEKKAAEDTEEVSTSFKQNTTPEPQERVEPQPIQPQPEPEKAPQNVTQGATVTLTEKVFTSYSSFVAFVAGDCRDFTHAKVLAHRAKEEGCAEYGEYLLILKEAA